MSQKTENKFKKQPTENKKQTNQPNETASGPLRSWSEDGPTSPMLLLVKQSLCLPSSIGGAHPLLELKVDKIPYIHFRMLQVFCVHLQVTGSQCPTQTCYSASPSLGRAIQRE